MMDKREMKSALESMLFVWGDPLSLREASGVLHTDEKDIMACMEELRRDYESRGGGIIIQRFGESFQLCTPEENRDYIERLCNPVKEKRLSKSALEVLAIIAYRQPVTRGEMETIRGVRCAYVIEGLLQKGLIQELGRSEAIGHPVLYGTTDLFLRHFGIESLSELPDMEDEEFLYDKNESFKR